MFYRLLLAHLVGDFVLQSRGMVRRKHTLLGLVLHVGVVGLAMVPAVWGQGESWWIGILLIVLVHAVTDWTKIHLLNQLKVPPILPFLVDQAIHVLAIAVVVDRICPDGLVLSLKQTEPFWWIGCAYLTATHAISIALPLCFDPGSLMRRPQANRWLLIATAALVLTLAWRGLAILVPLVGLVTYLGVVSRLARSPVTTTFPAEFVSTVVVPASLGWVLS